MSIYDKYKDQGIKGYYQSSPEDYSNPHAKYVLMCLSDLFNPEWRDVLDLACGDGLITKALGKRNVVGCDPYLHDRYRRETGKPCLTHSFEDIANNGIDGSFDVVVISYGADLIEKSYEANFLYNLSMSSKFLLTIRPNRHIFRTDFWTLLRQVRHGKSCGSLYERKL